MIIPAQFLPMYPSENRFEPFRLDDSCGDLDLCNIGFPAQRDVLQKTRKEEIDNDTFMGSSWEDDDVVGSHSAISTNISEMNTEELLESLTNALDKDLGEELADVLFVVLCLANQTGVDLQVAFDNRMDKKTKRDHDRHHNNDKLK